MTLKKEFKSVFGLTGEAFGGKGPLTAERRREIWDATIHPDAIWEGPTFEKPVYLAGYDANAAFNEFLLSVVPGYRMEVQQLHETPNPDICILYIHGFGHTIDGGTYTQRYLSHIQISQGRFWLMREFCNPFETYKAFGKAQWEDAVAQISRLNIDVPARTDATARP